MFTFNVLPPPPPPPSLRIRAECWPLPSQQGCQSRGIDLGVRRALRCLKPKLSQLLPEEGAGEGGRSLHRKEPGAGRNAEQPPRRQRALPRQRSLGKRIPYTGPSFPLALSKGQKTERTGRSANPSEEPSSKSARPWDLSRRRPQIPSTVGNPRERSAAEGRGGRLQGSTGGGGPGREDFPAARLSSKSSLSMTPVPHRWEFLC